jgi:uncharacterized protein YndB with AHSA1/START domain
MTEKSSSALTLTLPSDREIMMTYVISAPRQLVYDAYTKCEHLQHWLGPRRYTMPVCEVDLRPGGAWHFIHRDAEGNEHGFRGEFRDVAPPERLSRTFEYEGMPGHVSLETLTLTERDGMLESGMEGGANESMERLAEYLHTMV